MPMIWYTPELHLLITFSRSCLLIMQRVFQLGRTGILILPSFVLRIVSQSWCPMSSRNVPPCDPSDNLQSAKNMPIFVILLARCRIQKSVYYNVLRDILIITVVEVTSQSWDDGNYENYGKSFGRRRPSWPVLSWSRCEEETFLIPQSKIKNPHIDPWFSPLSNASHITITNWGPSNRVYVLRFKLYLFRFPGWPVLSWSRCEEETFLFP